MPQIERHKPGDFCWAELGTTDQTAAKDFYSKLFGWTYEDSPMGPGETYTMFKIDGLNVAAGYRISEQMQGVPPHWLLYIAVADADQTAKLAKAANGSVMNGPFDVMSHGRMAVLRDPSGATFAIWQARDHSGIGIAGEENALCWADLQTGEPEKAGDFYTGVFGWKIERGQGAGADYLHIKNGDEFIGGIPPSHASPPGAPPHWLLYFQTSDCDGLAHKAEEAGATLLAPPMSLPNVGRISVIADPQGAVFALYEPQNAA